MTYMSSAKATYVYIQAFNYILILNRMKSNIKYIFCIHLKIINQIITLG